MSKFIDDLRISESKTNQISFVKKDCDYYTLLPECDKLAESQLLAVCSDNADLPLTDLVVDGCVVLTVFVNALVDIAVVDKTPKVEGRSMSMFLVQKKS